MDIVNQISLISNKFDIGISSMRNLVLLFPPMYLHYQNYLKKKITTELDIENNYDIPDLIQMINLEKINEKITKKKTISDKTYHLHEQLEILYLFFNTNIYLIYDMINTTLVSNFFAYITEILITVLTVNNSYLESYGLRDVKFGQLSKVREEFIQKFIENEFTRGIKNINYNLKEMFELNLSDDKEWPNFVEYFKSRNEIIHKTEVNGTSGGSFSKEVLEKDSKELIRMIDIFKKFKDKIQNHIVTLISN